MGFHFGTTRHKGKGAKAPDLLPLAAGACADPVNVINDGL